ncbi:MAG: hypothetical protein ACR2RB_15305 [Gammaproteobacteria bacterium]
MRRIKPRAVFYAFNDMSRALPGRVFGLEQACSKPRRRRGAPECIVWPPRKGSLAPDAYPARSRQGASPKPRSVKLDETVQFGPTAKWSAKYGPMTPLSCLARGLRLVGVAIVRMLEVLLTLALTLVLVARAVLATGSA